MENRFERYKYFVIPCFWVCLILGIEISISLFQFIRYKNEIKPYYVTPILRPLVRLFVAEDFVPRTMSMYEWPWDYKTDRARPGYYPNPLDPQSPPYTINSFGLRGKEFLIPKTQGTYRIVVYGGSTTFGSESTDDETYPARLEQILRQRTGNQDVEVINYGAHSKSLYWIAQQYFREVKRIEPDLIVINNIRNTFFDQTQKYTPYTDIVTPNKAYVLKVHLFLSDHLLLYRFMRRAIEKIQFSAVMHPFVNRKEGWMIKDGMLDETLPGFFNDLYPGVIEGIYTDAKKRGIRLMLVIEPIRCEPCIEIKGPTCMWGKCSDKVPLYYDAFRRAIKKMQEQYPDIIVLDPVEDMIRLADQEPHAQTIFYGALHLTPKGNMILADFIASKIMREKLLLDESIRP